MTPIKAGLIGCGAIGSRLAAAIESEFKSQISLCYVAEHHEDQARAYLKKIKSRAQVVSFKKLIQKSDFIIEAASPAVAAEIVRVAIPLGKKIMILSAGGLLSLSQKWFAKYPKASIKCPSGALAGVDAVLAARESGPIQVKLITRKPPRALEGAPFFKGRKVESFLNGKKPVCIFKGNVRQAVKGFPKNINVSMTLSLAGAGAAKTKVEIWTARGWTKNEHEVQVSGKFGQFQCCTINVPSPDNPKTSYLAVLSAIALLRKTFAPLKIGT